MRGGPAGREDSAGRAAGALWEAAVGVGENGEGATEKEREVDRVYDAWALPMGS